MFHDRTGSFVTLSNSNKTAVRNHPSQEFNNAIVMSNEPLRDNELFEVKIDRKVNSWSGSIELGVTTCDPGQLLFPSSATGFREGTWIMLGCSVLKDGQSIIEEYGHDLDQLAEGDRVGVMRKSTGALHFYINGADQGQAVTGLPSQVYAVIDLYGKCSQVSIIEDNSREAAAMAVSVLSNELANAAIAEASYVQSNERLVFHERVGSLIKLSNNRRTAERRRPMDEFNNGVVMTNRPLKDDELFEIRLDRLVDKWSGSIEVGITTHNPGNLDFPATMTNLRSGTVMMSGCGILTNGKGTRREYGEYNLDELTEGDRIGLIRKSNGCLYYYINGIDQGVAATKTAQTTWGVVDLYGMAVKVTMMDAGEPYPVSQSIERRANSIIRQFRESVYGREESAEEVEKLLFHPSCGEHCSIINGQRTAHRPNAMDDFNHGVAITNRLLRPVELFEVRIDTMVDKWAGSIEIGVTTHAPSEMDFPSTMTNIRSGTWMMTGNGIMHNGTTVIDDYGRNLDRLKVGDTVSVLRKEDGSLHFYVNGDDQGPAASNVPGSIYGVIDLYGQAAQATIVDKSILRKEGPAVGEYNWVDENHY